MKKIKVSFDYDKTLSEKEVQDFAKELVNKGIEVWIVTRRYDCIDKYSQLELIQWGITNLVKEHQDLFDIAYELGIPTERIVFMNNKSKTEFFIENQDFLWHLDDNYGELMEIMATTYVVGIWYNISSPWLSICSHLVNLKQHQTPNILQDRINKIKIKEGD